MARQRILRILISMIDCCFYLDCRLRRVSSPDDSEDRRQYTHTVLCTQCVPCWMDCTAVRKVIGSRIRNLELPLSRSSTMYSRLAAFVWREIGRWRQLRVLSRGAHNTGDNQNAPSASATYINTPIITKSHLRFCLIRRNTGGLWLLCC